MCKKQSCQALSVVTAVRLGPQGQLKALLKPQEQGPFLARMDGKPQFLQALTSTPASKGSIQPFHRPHQPFTKSWGRGEAAGKLKVFFTRFPPEVLLKSYAGPRSLSLRSYPASMTYEGHGVRRHPSAVTSFQFSLGKIYFAVTFPGVHIELVCMNNYIHMCD